MPDLNFCVLCDYNSGQYDGKAVVYNDEECQIIRDDNVLLAYPGGNTVMTIDNVMPIRDYVLVELISPSKNSDVPDNAIATNSGIVIAASVLKDNLPCEGRVVKIGEGRMLPDGISFSASPVQVHDLIKFKEYAGNDILMNDGKQYSVVKMVDILCTYRNE
jgi:co-chaperonin GroES (HSP10)